MNLKVQGANHEAETNTIVTHCDDVHAGRLGVAGDAVNINSGTAKELRQVEGIGAKIAARIIAYRDQYGPFNSVDDLLQVKDSGEGQK